MNGILCESHQIRGYASLVIEVCSSFESICYNRNWTTIVSILQFMKTTIERIDLIVSRLKYE